VPTAVKVPTSNDPGVVRTPIAIKVPTSTEPGAVRVPIAVKVPTSRVLDGRGAETLTGCTEVEELAGAAASVNDTAATNEKTRNVEDLANAIDCAAHMWTNVRLDKNVTWSHGQQEARNPYGMRALPLSYFF
jgi:hypothetical protein